MPNVNGKKFDYTAKGKAAAAKAKKAKKACGHGKMVKGKKRGKK